MDIDPIIHFHNNKPIDDFCGLSSSEMHRLIHEPLSKDCVVRLKEPISDDTLDKIPVFRLLEDYLALFDSKSYSLKLTVTGALKQATLRELYSKGHIIDDYIEFSEKPITREVQWGAMYALNGVARLSGLVRLQHNKLFLTNKAKGLMKDRVELFKHLLHSYAEEFNWCYMDGYPDEPLGQIAWPFNLYLLNKYAQDDEYASHFAKLYKTAFPQLTHWFNDTEFMTGVKLFANCYETRTFSRFLSFFGLIELDKEIFTRDRIVKASPLLNELFVFE